jgi:general secretion pathway protein C
MATERMRLALPFGVSTLSGVIVGVVALIAINASLLRVPDAPQSSPVRTLQSPAAQPVAEGAQDYKALMERNLFRAKLQVEIPKPKTEKEIEEEMLTATVKVMALKGVMMSDKKKDTYAVIDLGGQKGVWTYEKGEVVDKGLVVKEIRKDSVKLEKGEFGAILKLFSPVYERTKGTLIASTADQQQKGVKMGPLNLDKEIKEIKKERGVTLIPKSLAEKVKVNNNIIMSSIAVKAANDGLKVVAVDKGSLAQRIGILPDDTLQEVNGHRLDSSEDMNKIFDALKDATNFDLTVMRGGKPETLRYEIR